jgi:hypothetical protein
MNIKDTFLALTSKTYPYGFEDELVSFLPKGYFQDRHGNYFYKIGESRTAFTSHLDTACKDQVNIVHEFDGNIIKTDGKSILGADDKAGVTILLYMIEKNVPGLYCFFFGEEVGCIGSGLASSDPMFKDYNRMISFDRRGTNSIITFQSSKRCCSEVFAKELSKEYNRYGMTMAPDDTGVYTDSAEFTSVIPECTNISVGYYKEHTHTEQQDITHLIKLCDASVKINWENLSTKRDPKLTEYKSYSYNKSSSTYSTRDSSSYSSRGRYTTNNWKGGSRENSYDNYGYYDDWYDQTPKASWEKKSKNHVASVKGNKVYLNNIDNEITDLYEVKSKKYYESLKQIIFDDRLSARDFEIIRDQYLDMDDPGDKAFYDEIIFLLKGL